MRELVPACPPGECVEQQCAHSLRRAVHRGAKTRRPGADDDEIVNLVRRRQRPPQPLRNLPRFRVLERGTVVEEERRQLVGCDSCGFDERGGFRVSREIDPAIRNQVPDQERFDRVRPGRPLVSDETDAFFSRFVFRAPVVEEFVDDGNRRSSGGSHGFER